MNHKPALICLVASVAVAVGTAQAVVTGDLSVNVEVEDFVTCDPVVKATFPAGVQRVVVEWSKAEDGEFVALGVVENPAGTAFAHTNALALIAERRWYRVSATDADGSASSAAVPFARFRQLERRSTGKNRGLIDGSVPFNSSIPFDGKIDGADSVNPIGVNFRRQVHLAGFRLNSILSRENGYPIYGAKSYANYTSDKVVLVTPSGALNGKWKFFASSDVENTYECCFISPQFGSLNEFEIYGWDSYEAETANGCVYFDLPDLATCAPVLTATFPAGSDSVSIEEARSANGPFAPVVTVLNPAGASLVWTNESVKVAVKRYYRVSSMKGGATVCGVVRSYTRCRRLERNPADEKKRFDKYTYWAAPVAFNGSLTDTSDAGNPCGVWFHERVWLAGVRTYPLSGWAARLNWRPIRCSLTKADYDAKIFNEPSSPIYTPTIDWAYTPIIDQGNAYECVWVEPQWGSIQEMQIYGWDAADIEAAHEPVFPTRLTAVAGAEEGSAELTWEGAHFISSYKAYYREEGAEAWTLGLEDIEGAATACSLSGLVNGKRYEFRLEGTGEDGYVGVSPTALALIFHYTPAGGTGLSALLMGNSDIYSATKGSPCFESRHFVAVDIDQTVPLFQDEANANCSRSLVMFRGEIEIPVDGTYTFRVSSESNDGVSLMLDGVEGFNKHPCGGFGSVTLELKEGRHALTIDWKNNVAARKYCQLTWACAGVFAEEVVPSGQLFPVEDADLPWHYRRKDFDYTVQTSSGGVGRFEDLGDGKFRISGGATTNGRWTWPTMSRIMSGKFVVEGTIEAGGYPSLVVASTETDQAFVFTLTSTGWLRVQDGSDLGPIDNSWNSTPSFHGVPYQLRVERDVVDGEDTLTFKVRNAKTFKSRQWATVWSTPVKFGGRDFSGKRLRVGFAQVSGSSLTVSDLRFLKPGGIMLIVR